MSNSRVFRWEVEDPDELTEELDMAGVSCDHLIILSAEELEMMRSPRCLDTLTVSQWDFEMSGRRQKNTEGYSAAAAQLPRKTRTVTHAA